MFTPVAGCWLLEMKLFLYNHTQVILTIYQEPATNYQFLDLCQSHRRNY
jgi:hypothetical protein